MMGIHAPPHPLYALREYIASTSGLQHLLLQAGVFIFLFVVLSRLWSKAEPTIDRWLFGRWLFHPDVGEWQLQTITDEQGEFVDSTTKEKRRIDAAYGRKDRRGAIVFWGIIVALGVYAYASYSSQTSSFLRGYFTFVYAVPFVIIATIILIWNVAGEIAFRLGIQGWGGARDITPATLPPSFSEIVKGQKLHGDAKQATPTDVSGAYGSGHSTETQEDFPE